MSHSLRPRQLQCADLLGRGLTRQQAADEVGVARATVQRWVSQPEFQGAVQRARRRLLAEAPTAAAVLESALHATRPDGTPDWQTRVTAARALLPSQQPSGSAQEQVHEAEIFVEAK